jgi:hypothetical protein
MCAIGLRHPAAARETIEFGGPEALSPLQVVAKFETIGGKQFQIEHVPEPALRAQFDDATDSLQRSVAGLMLGYAYGDAMNMSHVVEKFGITLSNVDTYARRVFAERGSRVSPS